MYGAGDISDLLDQMDSPDEWDRSAAEGQLARIGSAAIPEIIDALDAARKAESAVRTIRELRQASIAIFPIVIVLAFFVLRSIVLAISVVTVGGVAALALLHIRARGWALAARRGGHARRFLEEITDTDAIEPLAARFAHGYRISSPEAAWTLSRLLPSLTPGAWKRTLSDSTTRSLAQVLVVSNADDYSPLLVGIFNLMAKAGDTCALYNARMIASSTATTDAEELVVQAAAGYISEIERSAGRRRDSATLLRAAESPSDDLLRPAADSDSDESLLLRPATPDESGNAS